MNLSIKRRLLLLCICSAGGLSVLGYTNEIVPQHWDKNGAIVNGYILDFASKFKEIRVDKPKGYSVQQINDMADKYAQQQIYTENSSQPHIIVIMDEAFADLNVIANEMRTNTEVTPFISSLKEDTVRGYALASVYGGNTANSEYEFLTGNSMAFLSPTSVPYQQYLGESTYSMVSYLKMNYDYHCIAMHPFLSDGWNRPDTYKSMGFDECLFMEDFPQKNYVREYISDQEMFEKIVDIYENSEEALFLFGVSMQNHGDYTYTGENFEKTISLQGYDNEYEEVEQYLSLINETDKAVEYLLSYFSKVDDEVVIAFFGDHQPMIDHGFYGEIGEDNTQSLEVWNNRYKVPFFVWTNYDSDEKYVECTSLNYLSSYVYESAGIDLPPYNLFLSEMEENIPAINANGFYSLDSMSFLQFDEASKEEKEWLEKYEMMQYNCMFDKFRNSILFPILN